MTKINGLRSLPVVAIMGAMTCWSSVASADPITVDFEITGFAGPATLTGWFTGDDSTGFLPGVLGSSEITAFELNWSGNSTVAAFTHMLSDLRTLVYDIGANSLVELRSTSGGGFFDQPSAFLLGPFSSVRNRWATSTFHAGVTTTTTKVPEPGTLMLFGIGLLGLGLARRRAV